MDENARRNRDSHDELLVRAAPRRRRSSLVAAMSSGAASFVPRWLTTRIDADEHPDGIGLVRFDAALLFVDVSGFSALASSLAAEHGTDGADQLSRVLNDCFGRVVELIVEHGGEVVRFAGDAVLACWPIEGEHTAAEASTFAAACGVTVAETVRDLPMHAPGRLQVRIGMGVGSVEGARVGGHDGRWEPVIAGPAIDQVASAVRRAKAGDVIVSREAWAQLSDAQGELLERDGLVKLRDVTRDDELYEGAEHTPVASLVVTPQRAGEFERRYVSSFVANRIASGLDRWISELRTVTTLFINLGRSDERAGDLETLHRAVGLIQIALEKHFGTLKEVSVDDKGVIALGAFGLPASGGPYRPRHGVQCALELSAALSAIGLSAGFGLATGKTFCGPVGTDFRREYAVVGITVNLAARLAALGPGVRCDATTFEASESLIQFAAPSRATLKGFSEPVAVSRAESVRAGVTGATESTLVGRRAVVEAISAALEAGDDHRSTVVLEGESGIGKSRVVAAVSAEARSRGVIVLTATADPVALASAYHAWRSALESLLGIPRDAEGAERTLRVQLALEKTAHADLAPLLNPVLLLSLADSARTASLKDFVRADATQHLLVEMLRARADDGMLVVAEDWHWFDPASRAVLAQVRQHLALVGVLVATRPLEAPVSSEHAQMVADPSTRRIGLDGLSVDEVSALVCDRLGVAQMPHGLIDWIHQRARGNPFFSVELAAALKASGLLAIRDSAVSRAPSAEELEKFPPPPTIEGTVRYRVDRVSEHAQLTLKAASVLGLAFEPEALSAVHPMGESHLVERSLTELVDAQLCDLDAAGYSFRHRITRDVAYSGMLQSQRAQMHKAAAIFYEKASAEALRPMFPLLAHHWAQTDAIERALPYLEGAWEDANFAGSLQQAYQLMAAAVGVDDRLRKEVRGVPTLRRARWLRAMADASVVMGEPRRIHDHARGALEQLEEPRSSTPADARKALLYEVFTHIKTRAFKALPRPPLSERDREASLAWTRLAESLFYVAPDPVEMLTSMLRAVNLAERGDGALPVTTAYGQLAMMSGALGFDRLAQVYLADARRNAEACDSPRETSGAMLTQIVVHSARARWSEAHRGIDDELLPLLRESRNSHLVGAFLSCLGANAYYTGEYARAERRASELFALADALGNGLHRGWSGYQRAQIALRRGDFAAAERHASVARDLLTAAHDGTRSVPLGVLAECLLRANQWPEARAAAEALMAVLGDTPTHRYTGLEGHAGAATVFLELAARSQGAEREALWARAEKAIVGLEKFARRFEVGTPRALTLRGSLMAARGRTLLARVWLQRAATRAAALSMPFEEAKALAALGRLLSGPRGLRCTREAAAKFEALGCAWERSQLQHG